MQSIRLLSLVSNHCSLKRCSINALPNQWWNSSVSSTWITATILISRSKIYSIGKDTMERMIRLLLIDYIKSFFLIHWWIISWRIIQQKPIVMRVKEKQMKRSTSPTKRIIGESRTWWKVTCKLEWWPNNLNKLVLTLE